jgi:hypothetical protein
MFSPPASSGDEELLAHAVTAKDLFLNDDQCLEYAGHSLVRGRAVAVFATVDLQTCKLYFVRNMTLRYTKLDMLNVSDGSLFTAIKIRTKDSFGTATRLFCCVLQRVNSADLLKTEINQNLKIPFRTAQ